MIGDWKKMDPPPEAVAGTCHCLPEISD